jgi:hypothetical protein
MKTAIILLSITLAAGSALSAEKNIFKPIDKNKDGKLTIAEYLNFKLESGKKFMERHDATPEKIIERIPELTTRITLSFIEQDTDENGTLDETECKN